MALFQQVKGFIVGKIESGEWPPETRIPSESELIKLMSVSRMTVHRALRELAVDGYLVRHPGVGTFVSVPRTQSALFTIRPISEEISRRGAAHTAELQLLAEEPATREVAAALGLQPDVPVYHSVIVHMADGLPVELEDRYVNPAVAPDFLCKDFTRTTPSHYLFQVGPLTKAEHIFQAVIARSPHPDASQDGGGRALPAPQPQDLDSRARGLHGAPVPPRHALQDRGDFRSDFVSGPPGGLRDLFTGRQRRMVPGLSPSPAPP